MNNNIDLTKILKDCPRGTKFYSPYYGDVTLEDKHYIDEYPLLFSCDFTHASFACTKFGYESPNLENSNALPTVVPSADNFDWSTFKAPTPHKHFEPYQKGLVTRNGRWKADFYSHFDTEMNWHVSVGGLYRNDDQILAYYGNESLLGKEVEE